MPQGNLTRFLMICEQDINAFQITVSMKMSTKQKVLLKVLIVYLLRNQFQYIETHQANTLKP